MHRVLFVCTQNRMRSPTAERVFSSRPGFEVASAGVDLGAVVPVSAELVQWADVIFVMEPGHQSEIARRFRKHLTGKKIICLDIPDLFEYMDPELVRLLEARLAPFFRKP